jgi:CHAT domain-containing protein
MSMGRAFQIAGSKSVIVSLWAVFEPSSVMLTNEFFKSLSAGATKRQALERARMKVRAAGYEHPFFWSAFVPYGEWDSANYGYHGN